MFELDSVTIIMKKTTCANRKNKDTTNSNYSKKKSFLISLGQDSFDCCAKCIYTNMQLLNPIKRYQYGSLNERGFELSKG